MIHSIIYKNTETGTTHSRSFYNWSELVDHLRLAPHTPTDELTIVTADYNEDDEEDANINLNSTSGGR